MNRKILNLAIPNIISNITIPLIGMVDIALMGHLGDKVYIGAIAVGGMIFNFIYWSFSFLRMGTSGFTAQAFGKNNQAETATILARALIVAFTGALILIVFQYPLAKFSFFLIDSNSETVETIARQYFHIRIFAAPATIALYAFTGWFLGMQNARIPMFITLFVNVMNIGFSFLCIKVFGMKADGVALGTVIAQYSGLVLAIWFLAREHKGLFSGFNIKAILDPKALIHFFNVNKDIFIRTMCIVFALSFFTTQSARNNETILAVNALLLQLFMFFSFLIDGYAHAAEALTGRYVGSGNRNELKLSIKLIFYWAAAIALFFTGVYWVAGKFVLMVLTNNSEIISESATYMKWVILIPLITFPAFIWDGVFIGSTASVAMRNSMLISTVLVFIPAYYILEPILGNHGLWISFLLFMASRGVTLTLMAKKSVIERV